MRRGSVLQLSLAALGWTELCCFFLIVPLLHFRHAAVYHWSGTGLGLFLPVFLAAVRAKDRRGAFVGDFDLTFMPDDSVFGGRVHLPPVDSGVTVPDLSTAMQQLGLKLSMFKGQVEVLVIDHIERPSPN